MLVNVPLTDQLQTATNDGQPSENAQDDCVAAACDAAAKALGRALDRTPDWWKDQAYGQGYTGATDPLRYAAVFQALGLALAQVNAESGASLVSIIVDALHRGQPVLGAIPSQWGDTTAADIAAHGGPTHEVCFCDDTGTQLTAMNPWHGVYQTMPYAWWASRLVYGRVNPISEGIMAWTRQADGSGRDGKGHTCGAGCLSYLSAHNLAGLDGLTDEVFYTASHAFLALDNGPALRVTKTPSGTYVIDQDTGSVVADLWSMLQAARSASSAPPATPATPAQLAADAALRAFIGALHQYAQSGVSND